MSAPPPPGPVTIDWVEAVTGESGATRCEREGCRFVLDGTPVVVHGRYAAHRRCTVCGARPFVWLSDALGGRPA